MTGMWGAEPGDTEREDLEQEGSVAERARVWKSLKARKAVRASCSSSGDSQRRSHLRSYSRDEEEKECLRNFPRVNCPVQQCPLEFIFLFGGCTVFSGVRVRQLRMAVQIDQPHASHTAYSLQPHHNYHWHEVIYSSRFLPFSSVLCFPPSPRPPGNSVSHSELSKFINNCDSLGHSFIFCFGLSLFCFKISSPLPRR